MTSSIDISKEDTDLLYQYIGVGKPSAKLVIFGNEPGLANSDIFDTINKIREKSVGDKFLGGGRFSGIHFSYTLLENWSHPTTSEFARYISRLALALEHKNTGFLGELTTLGKVAINEHIYKPVSEKSLALINLRPLPRPTQDTWEYSNVDKKEYNKEWNFRLKSHQMTPNGESRYFGIRDFIRDSEGVVIGVGDKENKKAFLEKAFHWDKEFEMHKAVLDTHTIYFNPKYKIILSNYFNSRNGIKLVGLQDLYKFITTRKFM